jgi:hypothetical protein
MNAEKSHVASTFLGLCLGFMVGVGFGTKLERTDSKAYLKQARSDAFIEGSIEGGKRSKPTGVYTQDLNGDGITDIIVLGNQPAIFIGNTNGTYIPIEEYKTNQLASIRFKERELESSVQQMHDSAFGGRK